MIENCDQPSYGLCDASGNEIVYGGYQRVPVRNGWLTWPQCVSGSAHAHYVQSPDGSLAIIAGTVAVAPGIIVKADAMGLEYL